MQFSLIQRLRGPRDSSSPSGERRSPSSSGGGGSSSRGTTASAAAAAAVAALTSPSSSAHKSSRSGGSRDAAAAAAAAARGLNYDARPFHMEGEGSNEHLPHQQQQLGERLHPRVLSLRPSLASKVSVTGPK